MPSGVYVRTKEHNKKISEKLKGRHVSIKTEFKKGHKKSEETKQKMRNKKLTNKHKRKIGEANKGNIPWNKNKVGVYSEETIRKMSKSHIGLKHLEESKKKISRGKKNPSQETRRKQRIGRFDYMKEVNHFTKPNIGRHEKVILDNLEKIIGLRIERQYPVAGFYVDGYIPIANLAIEIDESHHKNQIEKDNYRENVIREELGCEFLRFKL